MNTGPVSSNLNECIIDVVPSVIAWNSFNKKKNFFCTVAINSLVFFTGKVDVYLAFVLMHIFSKRNPCEDCLVS